MDDENIHRASRVVLVEGVSDASALHTLAAKAGRDLAAEGVLVVAMGGAANIGHCLRRFGPGGLNVPLAGLCDAGEEADFIKALQRAGVGAGLDGAGFGGAGFDGAEFGGAGPAGAGFDGAGLDRDGLERLGFFVCVADLEDELIRSLGVGQVADVIEAQGEGKRLRTFLKQPAHRTELSAEQLRRFIGCRSGAKERYARVLTEALDPGRVPRPLHGLLAHL
jgi:OLD-like protein